MSASKTARNVVLSVVGLLVLIVGGGLAYTFFLGPNGSQQGAAAAGVATAPPEPVIKAAKPAPNAKESASVETLTSPVAQGENASINIKTNPGSKCTISVKYNDVASKDSGLIPKTADVYGTVNWAWTVDKTAPMGKSPVVVTCVYNTRSAVVQGDLLVQPAIAPGAAPAQ